MKQGYMKSEVLAEISRGRVVSGGRLASRLGVSRTAVWKAVNALRADGYFISGLYGGYVLAPENTRLCGEQLRAEVGKNIIFKEQTVSTNEDIKAIADTADEFTVALARRQTGGKGRLGRSFASPEGGLYFSVLLRPDTNAEACLKITTAAAVAMARAIETAVNKPVKIKWVNDIYADGKKLCGILTEGSFDAENTGLKYAVLGVGLNVCTPAGDFPRELEGKAGALFKSHKAPSLVYCALLKEFLKNFKEYYADIAVMPHLEEYRRRSLLTGREITYEKGGKARTAKVIGISDDAGLIIKEKNREKVITSGEVTLKEFL